MKGNRLSARSVAFIMRQPLVRKFKWKVIKVGRFIKSNRTRERREKPQNFSNGRCIGKKFSRNKLEIFRLSFSAETSSASSRISFLIFLPNFS